MNNKTMLKGCAVLAMGLMMAQCNENKQTSTPVVAPATGTATSGLKIAFVEVDSLLSSYEFCIEMNQAMVKKEENVRATLNDKGKQLESEQQEFQYKYENNAFTKARAEEEYNRLMKKAQELDALKVKLAEELALENQKNNAQLRDSIDNFLKIYNAEKQYDFIISNAGYDNLLYGNPAYNITGEIIEGLNARYKK
ncbi:MAG: OmpH family outer membrane protein [Bacteroidaceae bacterium]|nr:OmpH family outer membrane protein [Bacteroidaceae bacterium]